MYPEKVEVAGERLGEADMEVDWHGGGVAQRSAKASEGSGGGSSVGLSRLSSLGCGYGAERSWSTGRCSFMSSESNLGRLNMYLDSPC